MEIAPLNLSHRHAWAELLGLSFQRPAADMGHLLDWLYRGHEITAWGAWDEQLLVAQYACLRVQVYWPEIGVPSLAGMSLNMCVDPAYRGRGLVKQVAAPVYEALRLHHALAGVGFSNAQGVHVDRHSGSYGYQVVGKLVPTMAVVSPRRGVHTLELTDRWPDTLAFDLSLDTAHIQFVSGPESIRHRYADHPFRRYCFGLWHEGTHLHGIVVYRPVRLFGAPAMSLLAAYGHDLAELIRRWAASIAQAGIGLAHVLTTPSSPLLGALMQAARCVRLPFTRTPYYLTVKPLADCLPSSSFRIFDWSVMGGEIL